MSDLLNAFFHHILKPHIEKTGGGKRRKQQDYNHNYIKCSTCGNPNNMSFNKLIANFLQYFAYRLQTLAYPIIQLDKNITLKHQEKTKQYRA